jgi:hypothetical protein
MATRHWPTATAQEDRGLDEQSHRLKSDRAESARTRLEVRQWLPEHLASPSEQGWLEAFTKLDATLARLSVVAARNA